MADIRLLPPLPLRRSDAGALREDGVPASYIPSSNAVRIETVADPETPSLAFTPATPQQQSPITLVQPIDPPPLPPRNGVTPETVLAALTEPSPKSRKQPVPFDITPAQYLILGALLVNLLFGRISILYIAVLGVGCLLLLRSVGISTLGIGGKGLANPEIPQAGRGTEDPSVAWVNHALYALFPLISTDVLTPFIDLMEDALIQQVPPVVTSVRLTSPALGSQPVLLTSLRPMSDEEWFSSLASAKPRAIPSQTDSKIAKGHHHAKSSSSNVLSAPPPSRIPRPALHGRSTSVSSTGTMLDSEDVARETVKRRRRDRVLNKVARGRGNDSATLRNASQPEFESAGNDTHGVYGDDGDVEEETPDAGHYVNFQVGFKYDKTAAASRKGHGLHMLAYFGWGVKGFAKSEIPVYIDILGLTGIVNLRLLLSSTPPFVRTGTFSLPKIPEFDLSAKPLKRGAFNAMELPGMKSYVRASIAQVANAFVRPESYTIDIDRLLLGQEAALRTHNVGVLHIIIHGAEDLPKSDTIGTCDPYVSLSFSKYNKPLYSTRTIIDERNPSWEEPAFILVSADAIESGERLRLRLSDSDRYSADDSLGTVEVELSDLVDATYTSNDGLIRRHDPLAADKPGMKHAGLLDWSVRFYPVWQMPEEELRRRMTKIKEERASGPDKVEQPWWLDWATSWIEDKPEWEDVRAEKRKETAAWFTGERQRDELQAAARPNDDLRSGILQFHIHQCTDLEVESADGTYSSTMNHRKSAAGGKPALADVVDRTSAENPDPPSAFCEVHLNDRMVYRTRTKQVTPTPYFNAVSERFIRDWRMAKITFVVRDERDREHDPILGLVTIHLRDALAHHSHLTQWLPLVGGLGWGKLRISLLFKPIDMQLPPRISGFEVATLVVTKLSATDVSRYADRNFSVILETESDKFEVTSSGSEDSMVVRTSTEVLTPGSARTFNFDTTSAKELEWEISKPLQLAVEYRHSCSVIVSFVVRSGVIKKKKVFGIATIRLDDCEDGENTTRTVPIFATPEVKDAVKAARLYHSSTGKDVGEISPHRGSSSRRSSSASMMKQDARLIGFVTVGLAVIPGISRVHRKLGKRDPKFKKGVVVGTTNDPVSEAARDEDDDGDDVSRSDEEGQAEEGSREGSTHRSIDLDEGDGEKKGFFAERRAHAEALHKRNKGIFQLKIARTGKLVKDKITEKIHASTPQGQDRRQRGADMDVEVEGQSRL